MALKVLPSPTGYKAIIVGSYSDTANRVLDVVVRPPAGGYFMFPTEIGGLGNIKTASGWLLVALKGIDKHPTLADHWVVKVDRGYYAELTGQSQPGTYAVPSTDGLLLNVSAAAVGAEAYDWAKAASVALGV